MEDLEPDFSGWATKSDIKCTDGRTIMKNAFSHQHKYEVPLVWQHRRNDPQNVLGHAHLEDRAFGVYTYGFFDKEHPKAQHAKKLVQDGKIKHLSIYATGLVQNGHDVYHGDIEEVSLVPSGANAGAVIENVNLTHSGDVLETEAIIYTGLTLEHADLSHEGESTVAEETKTDSKTDEKTVKDVFDSLTDEQKNVVYYLIGEAIDQKGGEKKESKNSDSDDSDDSDDAEHNITTEDFLAHINSSIQEGFETMARNAFEQYGDAGSDAENSLSHEDLTGIIEQARDGKMSLKEAVLEHADYGIENLEYLFPDAKALSNTPDFIARRMEWVDIVLKGTKHSPFSRIKTVHADITAEEARARGYIKGTQKKDEVINLLRRTTAPTTIYKKQKLDRDDIIDITDLDVVTWLRAEMRIMLEEELARAILIGDGRSLGDPDKVKDPQGSIQGEGIRSILHDSELYAHPVELDANVSPKDTVKGLIRSRTHYRGSGKPTLFISDTALTDMMLEEDKFGRALYANEADLADKLRVSNIVPIGLFDEHEDLLAIMVNLSDYTVGATKGGEISNFEDFDIDFNQHKYLIETRLSGALIKPKSAIVVRRAQGTPVVPTAPSFDGPTNLITIPTIAGVIYSIDDEPVTGSVEIDEDTEVTATPDEGYYFATGSVRSWNFTYTD